MSKCYFCENKATVSVWGEMLIRICDDCWKEAVNHLKEKKMECKVCDENYTCPKCMECEDCEELEEVEDDDMF